MESLKIIVIVIVVGAIMYGAWQVKRSFNYAFDYEDKVTQTIETKYEERILDLEKRISKLENNKN